MSHKFDFLPVEPAQGTNKDRLKFTESYEVSHEQRDSGPYPIDLKVHPPTQNNNPASNLSSIQQQKIPASSEIRGGIQNYLKNRGSKASAETVNSFENARVVQSYSNEASNNKGQSQPTMAASKKPDRLDESKGLRLSQMDSQIFNEVQDEMGLRYVPKDNIDQSCIKVSVQKQQIPKDNIEHSNRMMTMQSQVRPYQHQRQEALLQRQLINLQESHSPLGNMHHQAQNHDQLLQSIKLSQQHFRYDDNFSKPQQANPLSRKFITQNFEKEIISAPVALNNKGISQHNVPEYTSINIRDQNGANIPSSSNKINYNRKLAHSALQVKQDNNTSPVKQYPIHQINHGLNTSQSIFLPAQQYQYPPNSSKGINFVRNIQHIQPQAPVQLKIQQTQQKSFNNPNSSFSYSRNLQHEQLLNDTKVIINPGDESILSYSSQNKSKLLPRNLQHEPVQSTILYADTGKESVAHLTNKKNSSNLSRNLQHEAPIPDTQLFINSGQQAQRLSSSQKLPLSRSLQHSEQHVVINEQQDQALQYSNILPKDEPQSFSLPVHQILADQSQLLNSKTKSQFKRNLIHENIAEEQSFIPEVSQRIIQNQFSHPPLIIQQPKQLPLNFDGVTTFANQKQSILLKRQLLPQLPEQNPLPSLSASLSDKICEGWDPSSKIFNLFKLSKHYQKTAPISFGKARISTALKK